MGFSIVLYGAILFAAAGRFNWREGWVYFGVLVLTQLISAALLIPRRPDLIAERSELQTGTKSWDRILAPAIAMVGPLAMIVTAGLDARFGWSKPLSVGLWALAVLLALGSSLFVVWAMLTNRFFASTVRIQEDRGQTVVRSGPYGWVRHPGYLGSVIFDLLSPLALGSWWAFIPAGLTVALLVLRTRLEDRTLQAELPGYAEYAREVRWRLLPGVW